jgi:hypothetical protein
VTQSTHNKQIVNKFVKNVPHFEYLRTTVTNQNYIHEEGEGELKVGMLAVIQFRTFFFPTPIQKCND